MAQVLRVQKKGGRENMTKVFFIGFTLFLLTPALPMTYGFESDMTATIHFADGEEVVCRKKATGKCYYNFVYPADLAMQGTRAKVVGENYKALTPDLIKSLPLSQPQPSPVEGAKIRSRPHAPRRPRKQRSEPDCRNRKAAPRSRVHSNLRTLLQFAAACPHQGAPVTGA